MDDISKPSYCCVGYGTTIADFDGTFMTQNARITRHNKMGTYFTPYGRRQVYEGVAFVKGLKRPEIFDNNPDERKEFLKTEALRIQSENQYYRVKKQRRNDLFDFFAGLTIGYIQGIAYEFADVSVVLECVVDVHAQQFD